MFLFTIRITVLLYSEQQNSIISLFALKVSKEKIDRVHCLETNLSKTYIKCDVVGRVGKTSAFQPQGPQFHTA